MLGCHFIGKLPSTNCSAVGTLGTHDFDLSLVLESDIAYKNLDEIVYVDGEAPAYQIHVVEPGRVIGITINEPLNDSIMQGTAYFLNGNDTEVFAVEIELMEMATPAVFNFQKEAYEFGDPFVFEVRKYGESNFLRIEAPYFP